MYRPVEYEQTELSGTVESVTFSNPENGFTVLDLNASGELVTAVGIMPYTAPGDSLRLLGRWDFHKSFGRQFAVSQYEKSLPSSAEAILRYLSSRSVKGVGPATALRIVEEFGDEALAVIEKEPERLTRIRGISPSKAQSISESFRQQFGSREVLLSLSQFGISPAESLRIFKTLGSGAVDKIRANPYCLCLDSLGFGFDRVDELAPLITPSLDPLCRYKEGIRHILRHNLLLGHTCLPREKVAEAARRLLECSEDDFDRAADGLLEEHGLVQLAREGRPFLFLPHAYRAERFAADRLRVMTAFAPDPDPYLREKIEDIERQEDIEYHELQRQAIRHAVNGGLLVLTGGPGTGKTTTLSAIIQLLEQKEQKILLAAPTGRAAKRISEVCGREAKTLHRLLEVVWTDDHTPAFLRNAQKPLECDAVIVDELSMVDIFLFSALLEALPLNCRLILVGDSDQLPSIGAGSVLHDIIESGSVPVVELKTVFRQAMKSLIVQNAHRIIAGENPVLSTRDNDFFFLARRNAYDAAQTVSDLYCERLPRSYGYDPLTDIQILCPSRKTALGTAALNRAIQERINPAGGRRAEIQINGNLLRVGDKVMQSKNNYDIGWVDSSAETGSGIFNGDLGVLEEINVPCGTLSIRFDDKLAYYSLEDAKDLEPAYAITIHKSQGSEYECVVLPIFDPVPQLCYRNLLYTAVTRARTRLIIVGREGSVYDMVANDRRTKRYTCLSGLLKGEVSE